MFLLDGEPISPDVPFEHDGVVYPPNWITLATPEEREAIVKASWEARHEYVSQFAKLDFPEALVVVHGLFPAMHILTEEIAKRGGLKIPKDRKKAIDVALSILLLPEELRLQVRERRGALIDR